MANPFRDMAESAREQHSADKANFEAARAEAKATWRRQNSPPKERQALMQKQRDDQIAAANARIAAAQERINTVRKIKEG